jgi:RNA polymerase sigma factor (TIGR02999 family)
MTGMLEPAAHTVTLLLRRCSAGDEAALGQVIPLVYDELLRLARLHMRRERPEHTLQPTALVHEAYVRLVDADLALEDRRHFFAVASRAMRRILVDHARSRGSLKRGDGAARESLSEGLVAPAESSDVLELDDALTRLAALDERKAGVVELHYFGGLSYEEIARLVEISPATVDRDLRFAKAWLHSQLRSDA